MDIRNRSEVSGLDSRLRGELQALFMRYCELALTDEKLEVGIALVVFVKSAFLLRVGWPDEATRKIFLEVSQSPSNWVGRLMAIVNLDGGWKDHPDTLPILKARARVDDRYDVRMAAVKMLAKHWNNDSEVQAIVEEHKRGADAEPEGAVRIEVAV